MKYVTVYKYVGTTCPENGVVIKMTQSFALRVNTEPHEIALPEGKDGPKLAILCDSCGKENTRSILCSPPSIHLD